MKEETTAFGNIGFRNVRPTDLSDIMRIEHASFSSVICESATVYAERIRIFTEGFRIITHRRNVIGFLSTELWLYKEALDEHDFQLGHAIAESHHPTGTELYVSSMGLDPRYRGAGLGRLLFSETLKLMQERFPQIRSAVLIVSKAWSNAWRIYKANGFEELMTLKDFFVYPVDEPYYDDGIVMRKIFKTL